jgi:hypothetical protein
MEYLEYKAYKYIIIYDIKQQLLLLLLLLLPEYQLNQSHWVEYIINNRSELQEKCIS